MPGNETAADRIRARGGIRRKVPSVVAAALIGAAGLATADAVSADPQSVVNALRTEGCENRPGSGARVRPNDALDDVAREMSRNRKLGDAIGRVGYPVEHSTSFHVRGSQDDAVIRRFLAERYCTAVNDPRYSEIGVFQSGDETWVVLASRLPPPPVLDSSAVARRVLELVNAARGEARRCGRDRYDAAEPLTLSTTLTEAALTHALDMAQRGSLGHSGSDGSMSADRITRAGYRWRASGENIAAGQRDADAVVAGWLASPAHCATLMGPQFTEMGIAFALAPSRNPDIYWTQVFAAPR